MKRILLILLSFICAMTTISAKDGLLIVAHGARIPQWNQPALALEGITRNLLKQRGITSFACVRAALMEYSQPSVANVIKEMEAEGVDRIFAMPVFISPSSHTEEDLPNILGHKYNPATLHDLIEEGTTLVSSKVPVVLGPTLIYSDVISNAIIRQVKALSKNPKDEALILLAHGDEGYMDFWNVLIQQTDDDVKKALGFSYTYHGFVEMGQEFAKKIIPTILDASKKKKRIILQGIYLVSGIKTMAQRFGLPQAISKAIKDKDVEIVYSEKGLLPDANNEVADWIVKCATSWQKLERK